MYSVCEICGKYRNQGKHVKCSRTRLKMYGPDTEKGKLQRADREGRKAARVVLPSRRVDIVNGKSGLFSRFRKEDL